MFSKAAQLLKGAMTRGSGGSSRSKAAAAAAKQAGPAAVWDAAPSAAAAGSPAWDLTDTHAMLPQQQSFDDARGRGSGDQGFSTSRDVGQAGFSGKALASPPLPAAAGASVGAVGSPQFGAWEVAGMALPVEAMSDTAYVTTRSRRH